MPDQKRYGVRLTLPGAPDEPHQIPGLTVLVRPGEPTEVDAETAQTARALIEQGAHLEVVDLKPPRTRKPPAIAGEEE